MLQRAYIKPKQSRAKGHFLTLEQGSKSYQLMSEITNQCVLPASLSRVWVFLVCWVTVLGILYMTKHFINSIKTHTSEMRVLVLGAQCTCIHCKNTSTQRSCNFVDCTQTSATCTNYINMEHFKYTPPGSQKLCSRYCYHQCLMRLVLFQPGLA